MSPTPVCAVTDVEYVRMKIVRRHVVVGSRPTCEATSMSIVLIFRKQGTPVASFTTSEEIRPKRVSCKIRTPVLVEGRTDGRPVLRRL